MYITFDALIGFCMFIIALVGLCYQIFGGQKAKKIGRHCPTNDGRCIMQ